MVALGDEEQSLVAPLNIRFRRKNAAVQSEERSKPNFFGRILAMQVKQIFVIEKFGCVMFSDSLKMLNDSFTR